jgi:hypothetical protein
VTVSDNTGLGDQLRRLEQKYNVLDAFDKILSAYIMCHNFTTNMELYQLLH